MRGGYVDVLHLPYFQNKTDAAEYGDIKIYYQLRVLILKVCN